jgi:hypothetical protein
MKAIEILYNLSPYQSLLEEIYKRESKEDPNFVWTKCLRSQYSFITLELRVTPKDDLDAYGELVIQVTFELIHGKVVLSEIYCEEESKKEELEQLIKSNKAVHDAHWHEEPNNTWYHDEKVTAYINMADEIAHEAYNCNIGDDYRPGCFSEIKVEGSILSLSQVNLHHAKSSDHKEDYHMRKLFFYIPLTTEETIKTTFDMNYQIGEMQIAFSDHSSPKNRGCGQKVVEQILHQKAGFEKSKE